MSCAYPKLRNRLWASAWLLLTLVPAWADPTTSAAHIPFKTSSAADDALLYRAIVAFLLAGAAAYGLAWCIKRFLPALGKTLGQDKQLARLESIRLSPRSTLIRVRYGDEELLLGDGEHGVTLLAKRPVQPSNNEVDSHDPS